MRYLLQYKRMVERVSLYSKCSVIEKNKTKLTFKYGQTRKEPKRASFLQM